MAKGAYSGVEGVARKVKAGYVGVDGVARQFYSGGKPLSEYAVGSIVLVPENGTNVEFYVAKHDYESGLNGAGRTLLVRKAYYKQSTWGGYTGQYSGSTVDTLLNGTYKSLFGSAAQTAIGTTKIYCAANSSASSATSLEKSIFLLSCTEYGLIDENSAYFIEGSALPIASTLRNATGNGKWTRSVRKGDKSLVAIQQGAPPLYVGSSDPTASRYVFPAFTLPKGTSFNPETNVILL